MKVVGDGTGHMKSESARASRDHTTSHCERQTIGAIRLGYPIILGGSPYRQSHEQKPTLIIKVLIVQVTHRVATVGRVRGRK